jgi:hypothetical protein
MHFSPLSALSPLDGRYADRMARLRPIFSEAGLIGFRLQVEARWVLHLAQMAQLPELAGVNALAPAVITALQGFAGPHRAADAAAVKAIEKTTNHDVKAVEYHLRNTLAAAGATPAQLEFVHFACTSEDINNLSYALMLDTARREVLLPGLEKLAATLGALAQQHAALPMLSRTHGQSASPTSKPRSLSCAYKSTNAPSGKGCAEQTSACDHPGGFACHYCFKKRCFAYSASSHSVLLVNCPNGIMLDLYPQRVAGRCAARSVVVNVTRTQVSKVSLRRQADNGLSGCSRTWLGKCHTRHHPGSPNASRRKNGRDRAVYLVEIQPQDVHKLLLVLSAVLIWSRWQARWGNGFKAHVISCRPGVCQYEERPVATALPTRLSLIQQCQN